MIRILAVSLLALVLYLLTPRYYIVQEFGSVGPGVKLYARASARMHDSNVTVLTSWNVTPAGVEYKQVGRRYIRSIDSNRVRLTVSIPLHAFYTLTISDKATVRWCEN